MGRSRFADLSAKIFVVDWESLKDNKCKKKKKNQFTFCFSNPIHHLFSACKFWLQYICILNLRIILSNPFSVVQQNPTKSEQIKKQMKHLMLSSSAYTEGVRAGAHTETQFFANQHFSISLLRSSVT